MKSEFHSREHLFINYATEDQSFADWLALKLTSEGYKVWYDRFELLGGESYPKDITDAIQNRTFRFLALLSHFSIDKENPRKELTLASNVSRELGIRDFIIPVKVDNIRPSELNFLTADLVHIPFDHSWYLGLNSLLKKLQGIDTPKNSDSGRARINEWVEREQKSPIKEERIWSNLLTIKEIPKFVRKYTTTKFVDFYSLQERWSFYQSNSAIFSFVPPPAELQDLLVELEPVPYPASNGQNNDEIEKAVKELIRKGIRRICLNKGMELGGPYNKALHFPHGLLPQNHINFLNYEGKKTFLSVAGERKFRKLVLGRYQTDVSRYHLTLSFKLLPSDNHLPLVGLRLGLLMTDLEEQPLEPRQANARRKAITRDWWNKEWLLRMMAVTSWLSDGKDDLELLDTSNGKLLLTTVLKTYSILVGIDEILTKSTEEESEILEENSYEEGDGLG